MQDPRNPPESAILAACLDLLRARRAFAWRQNSGALKVENRYVQFAQVRGLSDIIGVLQCGHFCAVETKSRRGRLTVNQGAFKTSVQKRGGFAVMVRSSEELGRELDAHEAECLIVAAKRTRRSA